MSEYVCIYVCLFLSPLSSASVCLCLFLTLSVSVGILLYFYNFIPYDIISILISIWATDVNEHESINIIWQTDV